MITRDYDYLVHHRIHLIIIIVEHIMRTHLCPHMVTSHSLSLSSHLHLLTQDLYVSNLCHKTSAIKDQLESGLYLLKRVGFYLRKVATSKRTCSVELNKYSDHELEKKDRIGKDRMHLHVNAYQQMQHVMTQMAFYDLKFGSDLLDRVAEPLLNWLDITEEREMRVRR